MKDSGKFGGWFEKGLGMLRGDGGEGELGLGSLEIL